MRERFQRGCFSLHEAESLQPDPSRLYYSFPIMRLGGYNYGTSGKKNKIVHLGDAEVAEREELPPHRPFYIYIYIKN